MHIPDGILSLPAAGTAAVLSATGLWAALRRLRMGPPRRTVALMGLVAAFVFAAQMINFPIAVGTSGHLLGAVLTTVLLGPWAAIVVLTAVLLVQCLLFADGGLLALGANVFNLAILPVLAGQAVYALVRRLLAGRQGVLIATAFGAWCSTVAAAISCAVLLSWSSLAPWALVFPAMASLHMLIGMGEAAMTTLVLAAILRARPDLVSLGPPGSSARSGWFAAYGLAFCIGLVLFGIPFASAAPDGLERVSAMFGFAEPPSGPYARLIPMADYRAPGVPSALLATSVAGVVGTVVAFALACAFAGALAPRQAAADASAGHGH